METITATDRLSFLAQEFDIFENETIEEKQSSLSEKGFVSTPVDNGTSVIALVSTKTNKKNFITKKISVSADIFSSILFSDPTENKIYTQWMLTVFSKLLKDMSEISKNSAIRLVNEDLPQAKTYLTLFEENKRKKKFKQLSLASTHLKHITDPTNINQYKNLSQVFDAVDPFIVREPSAVERTMNKFVSMGDALIPIKDRNFTVFIPKTTQANVIFGDFASWCTARVGNGMFNSYTNNNKKPNGKNSDIYIIINNKFFTNESDEIYQLHFETRQLKDRRNQENVELYDNVFSKSEALSNYFYHELIEMAKGFKKGVENNYYLNALISFGFTDSLFEMFDENTPIIKLMERQIPKLPDLSNFKMLEQLIIAKARLNELPVSIGNLKNLEMLVLTENLLSEIPREIGSLTKLEFLNLSGNRINNFPDEMKNLDKSNGGSLLRIVVREDEIGSNNYQKLKRLLPETLIN